MLCPRHKDVYGIFKPLRVASFFLNPLSGFGRLALECPRLSYPCLPAASGGSAVFSPW